MKRRMGSGRDGRSWNMEEEKKGKRCVRQFAEEKKSEEKERNLFYTGGRSKNKQKKEVLY